MLVRKGQEFKAGREKYVLCLVDKINSQYAMISLSTGVVAGSRAVGTAIGYRVEFSAEAWDDLTRFACGSDVK